MDSLNIDNRSKTVAFKQFKRLLNKYYAKFVKVFKKHPNKFDIRQCLVLLYDCVPNMINYWNIDRLLKNVNMLQLGTGKNPTTPLYSKTKKSENFFNKENLKITKRKHAFKGFSSTYNVEILSSFNPELKLKATDSGNKNKLKKLLSELRGFKFLTTLVLVFKKIESKDNTKFDNFYSRSKAEIIINESDIDDVFESIYSTIISSIQKSLGKSSGWIIDSVIDHTNII